MSGRAITPLGPLGHFLSFFPSFFLDFVFLGIYGAFALRVDLLPLWLEFCRVVGIVSFVLVVSPCPVLLLLLSFVFFEVTRCLGYEVFNSITTTT